MDLPSALKRFRKELGLTQKQCANALNIQENAYQRYEYGKVVPAVTVIINLADYFNVSTDYLLGRSDNPVRV